jgi:hypothetical protein
MVDVADEVKKHPVVRYLGLISAVAVASFGLTTQVLNETNKSTIGNYEQQLTLKDQQRLDDARKFEASIVDLTSQLAESRRINAGIPRGVSGATSILDVSKLTISPAEAGSISAAAQLYEGQDGGGFFALAPAQSAPWRYERTTELALFKELVTDAEASLPAGFDKTALTRFPVHRWVAPGTPSIEGLGPFKTLPTQILVQRMTSGDVRELFTAAFQTPLAAATESEAADLYRGILRPCC